MAADEIGRIKKRRLELARRRGFWYNIAHERQDRMSANENQIVVYQPNETVRLDVLAKRGRGEKIDLADLKSQIATSTIDVREAA